MADTQFELVVCIVNAGFSQNVMEAARAAGAKGGTILRARGSANPEAEEFFIILVPAAIKDDVLKAVYKENGAGTAAQGIAFSLPVNRTTTIKE